MIRSLKKVIDSYWARYRGFRIIIIAAFFLFMAVPIFLLYWYTRTLLGHSVDLLFIIAILIFGYIARKEGYVKQVPPKVRRGEVMVCGGLFTGFAILILLRLLFVRPLPSPYFLWLFLTLIVIGAYIGDKVGRKFKLY